MSKYKSVITVVDGFKFHSKKEAQRYCELKLLQRAGAIRMLRMQVPIILIDKSKYGMEVKYIADFIYVEGDKTIIEDVKGYRTPVYKLKKRLLAERYGIEIKET